MPDILIRGGTVVDGTGARRPPRRRARPRRRDRRGRARPRGPTASRSIDASGALRHPRHHRHAHAPRRRDVVEPRPRPAAGLRQHVGGVRQLRQLASPRSPARSATRSSTCCASSRTCRSRRSAARCRGRGSGGPSTSTRLAGQPTTAARRRLLRPPRAAHLCDGRATAWERGGDRATRWRAWCRLLDEACAPARSVCRSTTSTRTAPCGRCPATSPTTTSTHALFAVVARHHPAHRAGDHPLQRSRARCGATPSASPGCVSDAACARSGRACRLNVLESDERDRRCGTLHHRLQAEGVDFWPTSSFKPLDRSSASSARSCSSASRPGTRW